jgi:hypothetical protein
MIRDLGVTTVSDRAHGEHFGHHQRFRERYDGAAWTYHRIAVPAVTLRCCYPLVGDSNTSSGLMAAVGDTRESFRGITLAEMSELIRFGFKSGTVDWCDPSIRKLVSFMVAGKATIYSAPQTIMIDPGEGGPWVVEGNHRCLALILAGEAEITGVDWRRVNLIPGSEVAAV